MIKDKFQFGTMLRPNYAILVRTLPADRLEDFVNDWLANRVTDYVSHELWRGTGDMGRDVVGYVTAERMEGPWDKSSASNSHQRSRKLLRSSNWAKSSCTRRPTRTRCRARTRSSRPAVSHAQCSSSSPIPSGSGRNFSSLELCIAGRLVEGQLIPLSAKIEARIDAFDFQQVHWLDAARLVDHPVAKPALVHWFGEDPGRSPRGTVPAEIQLEESAYIGQLLRLYEERAACSYPTANSALASAEFGAHLRDQRTRFFDAVAFDHFYRNSTPDDYLVTFKDEIYHGVVDTHGEGHPNRLAKLNQVMKTAAILQLPGY